MTYRIVDIKKMTVGYKCVPYVRVGKNEVFRFNKKWYRKLKTSAQQVDKDGRGLINEYGSSTYIYPDPKTAVGTFVVT